MVGRASEDSGEGPQSFDSTGAREPGRSTVYGYSSPTHPYSNGRASSPRDSRDAAARPGSPLPKDAQDIDALLAMPRRQIERELGFKISNGQSIAGIRAALAWMKRPRSIAMELSR